MSADETPNTPDPEAPDANLDPAGLKDALGRTGRMLKTAGLPFEEDEFDDDEVGTAEFERSEGVDASKLATGVDAGEAPEADDDSSSESSDSDSSSSSSAEGDTEAE